MPTLGVSRNGRARAHHHGERDRDGNRTGFFRYPPRPAPNGTGFNLINGFGASMRFFFKPGAGSSIAPSHPALIIYKIKFNLNFKINLI